MTLLAAAAGCIAGVTITLLWARIRRQRIDQQLHAHYRGMNRPRLTINQAIERERVR